MIEANRKKEDILKKKGKYLIALLGSKDDETVNYFKCTDENIASGNSIFEENTSYKFEPEIRKTITLSTLLKDSNGFDLIKMDTQGSELSILEGGKEIVEKNGNRAKGKYIHPVPPPHCTATPLTASVLTP